MLRPNAAPALEVTHLSEGLLMASLDQVCLALWRSRPTKQLFNVQRDQLAVAVARDPGRQLFLCVIEHESTPPNDDLRQASSDMITAHGTNLAGCACVVEGTGFHAAINHTVLSGIGHAIHSPSPLRFFDSTPSACTWLQNLTAGLSAASLVEQVELARGLLPR